jgi:threonine aldolase
MSDTTQVIDLRSDTVTQPGPQMRRAITESVLGDDVFGDDPTVIALEERMAGMLGKEAALFVPSGTMGNLVALLSTTEPGDEVILDRQCHVLNYEVASIAVVGGVQANALDGDRGVITAAMIEPHIKEASLHTPGTRVIALENTHNRAGGHIFPYKEMKRVRELADERGIGVHLDGARLWNAHVESGISFADYGACVDTVSMCFSKGMGAPVGSIIMATAEVVDRARRWRKRLGGGMRQAGIIAAAALYAVENNIERLRDDHANATKLAGYIEGVDGLRLRYPVETNIVVIEVDPTAIAAAELLAQLDSHGVRAVPFGRNLVRMVTNLGVSAGDIERVGEVLSLIKRH